jgi:hypothetical protein
MQRLLPLVVLLAACATSRGFDRGAVGRELQEGMQITDTTIAEALARRPQLPPRFRVGVFIRDVPARQAGWRWSGEEKDRIVKAVAGLEEVGDAFLLSPMIAQGTDLTSLRLAAARHGADALLVVTGAADVDRYSNALVFSYFLVLPMLFIPASQAEALFLARAAMWDVRNEFLYLTAEAESVKKQVRPAAFIDERELVDAAKEETVSLLAREISYRLRESR